MAYDRDLRLRAIKYTEEGHTLAQAAAVFKVNVVRSLAGENDTGQPEM